jgi:hypothetical protein
MNTTRRDLLKFAGGSVVGALLTPAPWRLVADTAIWSENWPGIPHPRRGETRMALTRCGLCPAGCPVRARCVGGQPVSLAGVHGGLCVFGVAGHHLPYHPARIRSAGDDRKRVAEAVAKRRPGEYFAVLDMQPGRTASWTHRRAMAAIPNGIYLAPPQPTVAIDLAAARTVLSLGAPLLDGWIAPSRAFALRDRFRLIQVEAVESRTAALADRWVPAMPGGEDAAISPFLRDHDAPALAVDSAMSPGVIACNVALGSWGTTLFPRAEAPVPAAWRNAVPVQSPADVSDGSIGVLLIDRPIPGEPFPWAAIERKLAPGAFIAELGFQVRAPLGIPAAVYPEAFSDLPQRIDSPKPLFRLTTPIAPTALPGAAEFVAGVSTLPKGDPLRERSDAIHAVGSGHLVTGSDERRVKDVSADDFWKGLNAGGFWRGERADPGPPPRAAAAAPAISASGLAVVTVESGVQSSALLSKVYRESNLRLSLGQAAMHPSCGMRDGSRALLRSDRGDRRVTVVLDGGVAPGVVLVAALDLNGARAQVTAL